MKIEQSEKLFLKRIFARIIDITASTLLFGIVLWVYIVIFNKNFEFSFLLTARNISVCIPFFFLFFQPICNYLGGTVGGKITNLKFDSLNKVIHDRNIGRKYETIIEKVIIQKAIIKEANKPFFVRLLIRGQLSMFPFYLTLNYPEDLAFFIFCIVQIVGNFFMLYNKNYQTVFDLLSGVIVSEKTTVF